MKTVFRYFNPDDRAEFFRMVKKFYAPPAVLHFPSDEVMLSCFDASLENPEYIKGIMFEANGVAAGYAIVSMKFETEVGGMAAWIEELYVDDKFRGHGIGSEFFSFLEDELKGKIKRIRLEVGDENDGAKRLYERLGFEPLDYKQMVIDKDF